ncbi:hypothetical protein ACKWTF_009616 [Chironomus riparius]
MLEDNKIHVNTDVRQRFVPRRTIHINTSVNQVDDFWIATKVSKGDNVLPFDEGNTIFGQVLNFKCLHIQSMSKSTFYQDFVEIEHCEKIGLLLSPLYFIVIGQKVLMDIIRYFELKLYKCHVNANLDFTQEDIATFIRSFDNNI